jgi:uncharacterized protein (DUF1697 family)/N-acetylglutamate synthase-like GNAT family acetyltransferase
MNEKNVYLVLLRGINVGGNNIIKMNDLKMMFVEMGFTDVITYIQSGNIIFRSAEKDQVKLKDTIETTLLEKVKNKITVVVLTFFEMKRIISDKPKGFGDDNETYKYDVIFLLEPLKARDAVKAFNPKEDVDKIDEGKNVLYISRLISRITKSRFAKITGMKEYQNMTIRNWNTTKKLYKLMNTNGKDNIVYKKLDDNEITKAKKLILEYIEWLNRDLCFQNIDEELNRFPEKYDEPDGAFIIAKENENVIGCVGLTKLDDKTCEMKRLFVNDHYRSKGIGKTLVEKIIEEAKLKNYEKMRLDTLDTMKNALEIYSKAGFYEIEAYYNNPNTEVIYLEKILGMKC